MVRFMESLKTPQECEFIQRNAFYDNYSLDFFSLLRIKIVPETQEVSIVGEGLLPDGEWKWHGGLTTRDGRFIYGFANNANTILKLDTATDTISLIGGLDVLRSGRHRVPQDNKYKYLGGTIAPNGKIFLFPCDAEQVLMIDPETDEVSCVGPFLLEGENKYQNGKNVSSLHY